MNLEMKESERQDALLKRLMERMLDGSHRGQQQEAFMYALDECMALEVETMAALAENAALKKRIEELEQLLAAANLGWA